MWVLDLFDSNHGSSYWVSPIRERLVEEVGTLIRNLLANPPEYMTAAECDDLLGMLDAGEIEEAMNCWNGASDETWFSIGESEELK
jgi:hypothetical protein